MAQPNMTDKEKIIHVIDIINSLARLKESLAEILQQELNDIQSPIFPMAICLSSNMFALSNEIAAFERYAKEVISLMDDDTIEKWRNYSIDEHQKYYQEIINLELQS